MDNIIVTLSKLALLIFIYFLTCILLLEYSILLIIQLIKLHELLGDVIYLIYYVMYVIYDKTSLIIKYYLYTVYHEKS